MLGQSSKVKAPGSMLTPVLESSLVIEERPTSKYNIANTLVQKGPHCPTVLLSRGPRSRQELGIGCTKRGRFSQ